MIYLNSFLFIGPFISLVGTCAHLSPPVPTCPHLSSIRQWVNIDISRTFKKEHDTENSEYLMSALKFKPRSYCNVKNGIWNVAYQLGLCHASVRIFQIGIINWNANKKLNHVIKEREKCGKFHSTRKPSRIWQWIRFSCQNSEFELWQDSAPPRTWTG